MKYALCAGVLALAAAGFVPATTVTANAYDITAAVQPHIDIARIKSVLRLTPEQQAYWPPVEAALRGLAHKQKQSDGMLTRIRDRVASVVLDAATIARLGAAARPLVRVLDDRQKQDAVSLCQEMGLGPVLAALY
jgi:hypothetical protein